MQDLHQIVLDPCLSNILEIENLINSSEILTHHNKSAAALIVATEVFDNIVEHAQMPDGEKVCVSISENSYVEIEFSYKTSNFDELLEAVKHPKRYIDNVSHRYRGLGLLMVRNLVVDINYQYGSEKSSILIKF